MELGGVCRPEADTPLQLVGCNPSMEAARGCGVIDEAAGDVHAAQVHPGRGRDAVEPHLQSAGNAAKEGTCSAPCLSSLHHQAVNTPMTWAWIPVSHVDPSVACQTAFCECAKKALIQQPLLMESRWTGHCSAAIVTSP